jgi:hypothetical protein
MKKIACFFMVATLFVACKNEEKKEDAKEEAKEASKEVKSTITMPYKATYSSSFVFSDNEKNAQMVLQSYKDWEDNKLSNAPAYFADTITMVFPDGTNNHYSRNQFVKEAQVYRDSLASSKIEIQAYINVHSTDKNQDWVNVWYKQTDTWKKGKVDSAFYQDDNMLTNGKIVYVSSKKQAIKKMK